MKGKEYKSSSGKGSGNHEPSKSDQEPAESSGRRNVGNQRYRGKKKVIDRKKTVQVVASISSPSL